MRTGSRTPILLVSACLLLLLGGCEYVKLLRPKVLKQLNPRVVRLVNELPEVDKPNEAIVGRLFAHGGLSHAKESSDGVFHDRIYVPKNQYIWYPAIVVMKHGGDLELEFSNDDVVTHAAFVPSDGDRQVVMLPVGQAGKVRVTLNQPGLYWFGCPISNHAGRGMLGLVIVKGDTPPEAQLDRPKQPRP
ncbi:MAG TPA: MSMEG_3727 family PQQ-associated protein [Thermoanaerobaculia bacterium]|nr:MSMEG_3727 family PQQ-associated protein [Thermoanaerobaculia bacterium]